ncbi:hypothetical protein GGTG_12491 [Gaeumannomyces tritici R3-111a-1]|uniref:Histone chaperone RTT106/FACT complex subunit SPT16-like middle domain-containing protein n=1 Tax=Gaeumannomyces tritici (strain R3-111a-1) TaxID=644352 RepID=J3PG65_GAET3|nr:hypothetical protein GGTG_12491 [Gaeumannomyces tritici R3-111a-1]EJT70319.1 hypothetical protein GGTG_12491 [Gaeumannomyces tritici R3-111a-1]
MKSGLDPERDNTSSRRQRPQPTSNSADIIIASAYWPARCGNHPPPTMACRDQLDAEKLALVFQARPDIVEGIQAAADTLTTAALFNTIASFVLDRLSDAADSGEPASKRRRVNGIDDHTNGTVPIPDQKAPNGAATKASAPVGDAAADVAALAEAATEEELQLEIKEISIVVPQRKKMNLCFTKSYLYARTKDDTNPVAGLVYRWADIEHAFYVPIPEKAQQQWNYILFPRGSYLPSSTSPSPEPLVFTVPATAPKAGSVSGRLAGQAQVVSDSHSSLFHWAVAEFLRIAHKYHSPSPDTTSPVPLVCADAKVFASAVRQSHRPAEKAVHVRAFRGSKEGYLFFLPTGVLWGFKKPLLFLPLDRVVALSYTSVLQRTFNIVVEVDLGDSATDELEFSMLDQEDYAGISQNYVAKHRLQDRSMAEQRKAKRELAENAKKGSAAGGAMAAAGGEGDDGEGGGGAPGEDDGLTELERAEKEAEQLLQDEEDEDEEDYDPGSDGDSEGEGSSSDEDGSGGDGEGDDDDDDDDDDDEELPDADE